jgi:peptide deformylase
MLNDPLILVPDYDPILTRPCRSDFVIDTFLIDRMFNLMLEKKGLGLAAPQVGIDARLFVTRWSEVFINPRIKTKEIPCTTYEGCLSLPGIERGVSRFNKITLADGRVYTEGRAIVIQHELDHLNGVLITSYDDEVKAELDAILADANRQVEQ